MIEPKRSKFGAEGAACLSEAKVENTVASTIGVNIRDGKMIDTITKLYIVQDS
jgi:hypothetical protein